jgi:hypothetical protein
MKISASVWSGWSCRSAAHRSSSAFGSSRRRGISVLSSAPHLSSADASAANGSPVPSSSGVKRSQRHVLPGMALCIRRGISPAPTSDDLPDPLAPTTATKRLLLTCLIRASVSRPRPKKIGASSGPNARRPGNGEPCHSGGSSGWSAGLGWGGSRGFLQQSDNERLDIVLEHCPEVIGGSVFVYTAPDRPGFVAGIRRRRLLRAATVSIFAASIWNPADQ